MERNYDKELINSTRKKRKRAMLETDFDTWADRLITAIIILIVAGAFYYLLA